MVEDAPLPPMGWMTIQADLPYRAPRITGASDVPATDWLSPLRAAVRLVTASYGRTSYVAIAPLLSAVSWIRARLTLYDRGDRTSSLALVEVLS